MYLCRIPSKSYTLLAHAGGPLRGIEYIGRLWTSQYCQKIKSLNTNLRRAFGKAVNQSLVFSELCIGPSEDTTNSATLPNANVASAKPDSNEVHWSSLPRFRYFVISFYFLFVKWILLVFVMLICKALSRIEFLLTPQRTIPLPESLLRSLRLLVLFTLRLCHWFRSWIDF